VDAVSKDFRDSRIGVIEFFASLPDQIEWQQRIPALNSGEWWCWWGDDFYPDDKYYAQSFSVTEIELLRKFNERVEEFFAQYRPTKSYPKAEDLIGNRKWISLNHEAKLLAATLRSGA